MKYIFDFDDVLFNTTKMFKKHMYICLEKAGISKRIAEEYYKKVREKEFSLKNSIAILLAKQKINKTKIEDVYEKIMSKCWNFTNLELLKNIKKFGKKNCFIVSSGEKEFQKDKIKRSGIAPLFSEIIVVSESKKEVLEKICAKHKDEKIIFIDDKTKHFENLDFKKCPNLKTVLFTNNVQLLDALPDQCRHK